MPIMNIGAIIALSLAQCFATSRTSSCKPDHVLCQLKQERDETSLLQVTREVKHHIERSSKELDMEGAGQPMEFNKKFMYIRHGESAGNAGDITAYSDGKLTTKGENQAVDRVDLMSLANLKQITKAGLVLVSPLSRAMVTAVLVIAKVRRQCRLKPALAAEGGLCNDEWPRIVVDIGLREKVKSNSERPGCGWHDPLEYIDSMAQRLDVSPTNNFGDANTAEGQHTRQTFHEFIGQLKGSYQHARVQATGIDSKECTAWGVEPTDGDKYLELITDFKNRVLQYPEAKVAMFGHSGWARYAFAAHLPGPAEEPRHVLWRGNRKVHPLNNCGVASGVIVSSSPHIVDARGYFEDVLISPLQPGNEELPNTEEGMKVGVIAAPGYEAVDAGVFPPRSCIHREMLEIKASQGTTGSYEKVFVVLSWSPEVSVLSWSNKWGDKYSGNYVWLSYAGEEAIVELAPTATCNGGRGGLCLHGSSGAIGGERVDQELKVKCSDCGAVKELIERWASRTTSPCVY